MTIRSKHNDLLNYFIHDERDLSPAYVKKCERFLWSLRNAGLITKQAANTLYRLQASSNKRQAASVKQSPQLNVLTTKEYKKLERRFKK